MSAVAELYSERWHEVAGLRPALRAMVRHRRQPVRDRVWHQLSRPGGGRQLRLNEAAWQFVGLLDGQHQVGDLWRGLHQRLGDQAPTQPEILALLAQLHRAGLLQSDVQPDLAVQAAEARRDQARRQLAAFSPFAVRVRLYDPQGLVDRIHALIPGWALSVGALLACLAFIVITAAFVIGEWPALSAAVAASLHLPRFVLIAGVVYPLLKALHELAHGLAIRHWGGELRSAGFTLLVMLPVPFVDASGSSHFTPTRRMAVSVVGIVVELLLAALAFWLWLAVSPGWLRDGALTVFFLGAVSSVLFNANPLLRFDGYYIFSDALDLPNLASRSRRWWNAWFGQRVFGARASFPDVAAGERKWLIVYTPASWLFQGLVAYQLTLWAAGWHPLLGLAAALFFVFGLLLHPVYEATTQWYVAQAGATGRTVRRRLLAFWLLAAGFVLFVPLPSAITAPASVDLPEDAYLRADGGGFVRALKMADGAAVQPGDPIAELEEPALQVEATQKKAELDSLRSEYFQKLLSEPGQAIELASRIASAEAEHAEAARRLALLEMNAQVAGTLVIAKPDDWSGQYLPRGHALGFVLRREALVLRALVPEAEIAVVRAAPAERVAVRLASAPQQTHWGRIVHIAAAGNRELPNVALSEKYGGPLALAAVDQAGKRTEQTFFEVRIALDEQPPAWVGERAWVRFARPAASLAEQGVRELRQLFLRLYRPGSAP